MSAALRFTAVLAEFKPASPPRYAGMRTMAADPQSAHVARQEDPQMELAALVLFSSIALWLITEVSGPLHL